MTLKLVFDDVAPVADDLRMLVGVDRFGELVFRRKSRREAVEEIARAAGVGFVSLGSARDREALAERINDEGDDSLYFFCPSNLVAVDEAERITTFLRQIQHAPSNLHAPPEDSRLRLGWLLMRAPLARQYLKTVGAEDAEEFFDQNRSHFIEVRERLRIVDLRDERTLLDYLSGQFDVRHFNAITHDDYTVVKRSKDRNKLKREYDYYHLAPAAVQMFLLQPFDFRDDGQTASYRMERLFVPDLALQWVQGALQPADFERCLARIFHFLRQRPTREVSATDAQNIRSQLYVAKVRERIDSLKAMPASRRLLHTLDESIGGIDELVRRYERAYARIGSKSRSRQLVVGHGDLCFSNILYAKSTQLLKLIDPRGASSEADLYTDPYYDVAKLSHSVFGRYDFINQERFDIRIGDDLRANLTFERPQPEWVEGMFIRMLEDEGFDAQLVRLYEASLFVSMLPLHMDRPRKVLAFAINAARILDTFDGGEGGSK